MKFDLALKKMNKGSVMGREHETFTLRIEKDQIIRKSRNGAKTLARIASQDLLADDWMSVKSKK